MQCASAVLYYHLRPLRLYHIFLHYSINDKIFGKKVPEHKMCETVYTVHHVIKCTKVGAFRLIHKMCDLFSLKPVSETFLI